VFDELRAALGAARARAARPEAMTAAQALELGTLGSARALGLDDELGSLTPGKQADLTVVTLAGTPFVPWDDPAAAVVLGGGPGRVLATLVAGTPRYRKGGMQWHELTDAALSTRERLLRQPAGSASSR
jgi:5-methylthioadenosine/S-adenosylhomocysteine deaminase